MEPRWCRPAGPPRTLEMPDGPAHVRDPRGHPPQRRGSRLFFVTGLRRHRIREATRPEVFVKASALTGMREATRHPEASWGARVPKGRRPQWPTYGPARNTTSPADRTKMLVRPGRAVEPAGSPCRLRENTACEVRRAGSRRAPSPEDRRKPPDVPRRKRYPPLLRATLRRASREVGTGCRPALPVPLKAPPGRRSRLTPATRDAARPALTRAKRKSMTKTILSRPAGRRGRP